MPTKGDNSKTVLVEALNGALADHMALYFKSKNFHWHVAGPRFRDLHLLFDEQATAIIGVVDLIGERIRKNSADALTSIGSIAQATVIADQDNTALKADAMVQELHDDNAKLVARLRDVKAAAENAGDYATSGVVDDWIDQAEQRVWFLAQTLK